MTRDRGPVPQPVFIARRALRGVPDDASVDDVYAALATAFTPVSTPTHALGGAAHHAAADADAILDDLASALTAAVPDA
jgi:hypothetical protein